MANISNFVFFNEESTEKVSNYISNSNNAGALTLQVDVFDNNSLVGLTIEGMNDLTNPDVYHPVKCIGLADFKTHVSISEPGLYMIPLDGLYRLRLVSEGPVGGFKAYGVAIG